MPDRLSLVLGILALLSIGHYLLRRNRARQVALDWLRQHSYQPRTLTFPWFRTRAYRFAPAPLRNNGPKDLDRARPGLPFTVTSRGHTVTS
jgi:hypothetical protein